MKQTLLLFIFLTFTMTGYSQKIKLYRNSGSDQVIYLSSIDSIKFLPFECGDSLIYAGKTYHSILIGSQCWMKENLDVGTMINGNQTPDPTPGVTIEKYCYDDLPANCVTYGGLYSWEEAMQYVTTEGTKGICPAGWHIPTQQEFQTLIAAVNNDGNSIKAVGQGGGSGAGTNTTGFSALLGGNRETDGSFIHLAYRGHFWSSTLSDGNTYRIMLWDDRSDITQPQTPFVTYGFSVRCIKD